MDVDVKQRKSIILIDLPDELNTKPVITKWSNNFGPTESIMISKKNKYAIVHFLTPQHAMTAKNSEGILKAGYPPVKIQWSGKSLKTSPPSSAGPAPGTLTRRTSAPSAGARRLSGSRVTTDRPKTITPQSKAKLLNYLGVPAGKKKKSTSPSQSEIEAAFAGHRGKPIDEASSGSTTDSESEFDFTAYSKNVKENYKKKSLSPTLERRKELDRSVIPFKIASTERQLSSNPFSKIFKAPSATSAPPLVVSPQEPSSQLTLKRIKPTPADVEKLPEKPVAAPLFKIPSTSSSQNLFKIPESSPTSSLFKISNPTTPSTNTLSIFKAPSAIGSSPFFKMNTPSSIKPLSTSSPSTLPLSQPAPPPPIKFTKPQVDDKDVQALLLKQANTPEERYRLLDARDKIIRQKYPKGKMRVELAMNLRGTCQDMCPEKERYMRDYQRQVSRYEFSQQQEAIDHSMTIKAYSRSSADQEEPLPHELRPASTLRMTMNYLLHMIIPIVEEGDPDELPEWYNFVWDRTRSIRKDITQQQLRDLQTIELLEKCTRYHIYCSSRLCELDRHSFDPKLNDENLMKCLQSLDHMYTDLKRKGILCPNEPEFRSYQILMNLNEGDILASMQKDGVHILNTQQVQLALQAHRFVFENNFVGFFRLVKSSSFLISCILHRYFFQLRTIAIRAMRKATLKSGGNMPMSNAKRMLGYPTDCVSHQFVYFCEFYGIRIEESSDRIFFPQSLSGSSSEPPMVARETFLIESKLTQPVAEVINGGPLEPYVEHVAHSSFDNRGYLLQSEFNIALKACADAEDKSGKVPLSDFHNLDTVDIKTGGREFSFDHIQPSNFGITSEANKKMMEEQILERRKQIMIESFASNTIEKLCTEYVKEELRVLSREAQTEELLEKEIRLRKELLKRQAEYKKQRMDTRASHLANIYYEEIEGKVIMENLERIAEEEVRKRKVVLEIVDQEARIRIEELTSLIPDQIIKEMSDEAYQEELKDHAKMVRKLKVLGKRMHLRYWLETWKVMASIRKEKRLEREEKRRKLLEDFPASSSFLPNNEAVLLSWCGPDVLNSNNTSPKDELFPIPTLCQKLMKRIRKEEEENALLAKEKRVVFEEKASEVDTQFEDSPISIPTQLDLIKRAHDKENSYTQSERLQNLFMKRQSPPSPSFSSTFNDSRKRNFTIANSTYSTPRSSKVMRLVESPNSPIDFSGLLTSTAISNDKMISLKDSMGSELSSLLQEIKEHSMEVQKELDLSQSQLDDFEDMDQDRSLDYEEEDDEMIEEDSSSFGGLENILNGFARDVKSERRRWEDSFSNSLLTSTPPKT